MISQLGFLFRWIFNIQLFTSRLQRFEYKLNKPRNHVDLSFPSVFPLKVFLPRPFYDIQNPTIFFQKFKKISQIYTRKSKKNPKYIYIFKFSEEKTLILLYEN